MDASKLPWITLVLARTFDRPNARAFLIEFEFPDSVLRVYDQATMDPGWASAPGAADRAYIVLRVLETDAAIRAAFEADHDAGRLGLGAGDDEEFDRELDRLSEIVHSEQGGAWIEPPLRRTDPPLLDTEPPLLEVGVPPTDAEGPYEPESEMPTRGRDIGLPIPESEMGSNGASPGGGVISGEGLGPDVRVVVGGGRWPDDGLLGGTEVGGDSGNGLLGGDELLDGDGVRDGDNDGLVGDDDLLGGEEWPPTNGHATNGEAGTTGTSLPSSPEPEAERASPEVVETWLKAELDDVDTSKPLQVGEEYVLALSFGAKVSGAVGSAVATLTFPVEADHLDLTIRLLSAEFDTPPLPQSIRVRRNGTSVGRSLFAITPKKAGPAVLTAMVDFEGNFVQQLVLRFDVGGAPAADVEVTNLGRPAAAATVLEPREASLRFTPEVGGYKLFVPGVTENEVFVQITADQLAAAIEQVRSALLTMVKNEMFALGMDIPPDLGARALNQLAFAGFRLYQQIFEGPFASSDLRAVGTWLRDTLSNDVTTLQVVSSGFPVPWALIYLAERWDETQLDWENFIGMRHVVEQVPMREITVAPPSATIDSTPALAVRVLYNDGIDAQMPSHPVAAQRAFWEGHGGLELAEGTSAADLLGAALAPASVDKVLYLYCHAVASNTNPDDSHLVLSGDEKVTLGRLSAKAPTKDLLASHPLVFINACESGDLSPNFYDGFVPYFLGKGARGVIGTECKTPGFFASEWAKAFFDRFFAGERLGDTVLALRRQFLADHGNPLGLLYGVYCDPDTRVDPALIPGAVG
ncbi:CHAT domain-containing protein [Agromyces sp. NPDC004153]